MTKALSGTLGPPSKQVTGDTRKTALIACIAPDFPSRCDTGGPYWLSSRVSLLGARKSMSAAAAAAPMHRGSLEGPESSAGSRRAVVARK